MLRQVQTTKEKQHAIEDVFEMKAKQIAEKKTQVEEKKTPKFVIPKVKANVKRMALSKSKPKKPEKPQVSVKKVELTEKDKEIVFKAFSERLSGNVELIKDLCNSFSVVYEEGTKCINTLFDKIWDQNEDSFPNPYSQIASVVHTRLLILLLFSPCCEDSSILKIESEDISTPMLKRAHTEENPQNYEKIAEMRKWVDSYKKWKEWKDPKQELEESSPLNAIYNFTTALEIPSNLLSQSLEQSVSAAKRITDFQLLAEFLQIINLTPSVRLALGILPLPSPYASIQSCGKQLKSYLNEQSSRILLMLFNDLSSIISYIKASKDSMKQQSLAIKKETKLLSSQFQYTEIYVNHQLRLIISLLSDIYVLIKSEANCESVISGLNYEEILSTLIEIYLYCGSLHHNKLTMSVSSGVKLILSSFLKASKLSLSFDFKEKMQQEIMATVLNCLGKELVCIENSTRLEKLLALTFEVITSTGLHKFDVKIQLTQYLCSIILESSNPEIIRLAARISKFLLKEISPSDLSNNFVLSIFEKIGNYAGIHLSVKNSEKNPKYVVLLHSTTSEEDIDYIFPVLYEWEELYPNNKYTMNKSEEEEASIAEDPLNLEDIYESELLGGLPIEFDGVKKFAVYNRFYLAESGRGGRRRASRRGKAPAKKAVPKKSNNVASSLTKLEKIYEDMNKGFEDVKEGDTEEEKERKTKEKNFINKVKIIIKDALNIASNLFSKGLAQIGEPMSLDQAIVMSLLIKQHQNQLKVDTKHKLPVIPSNPFSKTQEPVATEIIKSKKPVQISISDNLVFQKIDYLMETGPSLPALRSLEKLSGVIIGNYSRPFLQKTMQTGSCISLCIQEWLELLCTLTENPVWQEEIRKNLIRLIENLPEENPSSLGALVAYGGWQDIIRPGSSIIIESNSTKSKEIVIQGGDLSGLKSCLILVEEDSNYSLKTFQLSELTPARPRLITKLKLSHDLIASALVKINQETPWILTAKRHLLLIASQIDWNS